MVGKQKAKTKKDLRRFEAISDIGCLACRQMGYYQVPAQVHHLTKGYRRGDQCTVGLCPWHHQGQAEDTGLAYKIAGPSLALNKKEFRDKFGTDEELLMEMDRLIRLWEEAFV